MNREWYDQYFERVDRLPKDKRVAFKRACGKTVSEIDAELLVTLYGILPKNVNESDHNKWLFATGVHCMWDSGVSNRMSVDAALSKVKKSEKDSFSESFEKRIYMLMDTEWDEYGFMADKYLKLVKMMKQKGYEIDAASVLDDLTYWNSSKRTIQKRWARSLSSFEEKKEEK